MSPGQMFYKACVLGALQIPVWQDTHGSSLINPHLLNRQTVPSQLSAGQICSKDNVGLAKQLSSGIDLLQRSRQR